MDMWTLRGYVKVCFETHRVRKCHHLTPWPLAQPAQHWDHLKKNLDISDFDGGFLVDILLEYRANMDLAFQRP